MGSITQVASAGVLRLLNLQPLEREGCVATAPFMWLILTIERRVKTSHHLAPPTHYLAMLGFHHSTTTAKKQGACLTAASKCTWEKRFAHHQCTAEWSQFYGMGPLKLHAIS